MRKALKVSILACICAAIAVSCDQDTTPPAQDPVSVRSYLAEVYGATYVSSAPLPSPTVPATVSVAAGDSALGRGSPFRVDLAHPVGLVEFLIGAEGAVGYFVLPVDSSRTRTTITGRLSSGSQSFTLVCGARTSEGAVLTPAARPIEVYSGEAVRFYITKVVGSDGTVADYVDATLPLATRDPTLTDLAGDSLVINGGSLAVSMTCLAPATAILVGVPNARGYFRLPTTGLPGPVSMVILIAQSAPTGFIIQFLSEEPGPEYGAVASFRPNLIRVGSGDLQVSLAFRPSQDLDLHLVEPTGEEIYYANRTSSSGGRLDLDSNPACRLDHKNNENITYEGVRPPSGQYIVRVDFWRSCDGGGAEFRVAVIVRGEVEVYGGRFGPDEADGGGLGSGREICRFVY